MAHITGGGIQENVDRIVPEGMTARIWDGSWTLPEIFKKIQLKGNVDMNEMKRVFNLGIGYCIIVPANRLEFAMDIIRNNGISCWEIGEVYSE